MGGLICIMATINFGSSPFLELAPYFFIDQSGFDGQSGEYYDCRFYFSEHFPVPSFGCVDLVVQAHFDNNLPPR